MPIRADSACTEDWASFQPREAGRHCGTCDVTVVDLSRLTRRKAEAMVRAVGGRMCARMRVDAEGEPLFLPETERAPRLLGVAALGLLAAACDSGPAPASVAEPPEVALTNDAAPSLLGGSSTERFGGSLMTTEHTPMRPLAGAQSGAAPVAATAAPPATGDLDLPGLPTAEQILLTEAKVEHEEHERARARRRRGRTTTASIAPGTLVHPLPPLTRPNPGNVSTPAVMYLGGISYTP